MVNIIVGFYIKQYDKKTRLRLLQILHENFVVLFHKEMIRWSISSYFYGQLEMLSIHLYAVNPKYILKYT